MCTFMSICVGIGVLDKTEGEGLYLLRVGWSSSTVSAVRVRGLKEKCMHCEVVAEPASGSHHKSGIVCDTLKYDKHRGLELVTDL